MATMFSLSNVYSAITSDTITMVLLGKRGTNTFLAHIKKTITGHIFPYFVLIGVKLKEPNTVYLTDFEVFKVELTAFELLCRYDTNGQS
jgi:hypothetical protein